MIRPAGARSILPGTCIDGKGQAVSPAIYRSVLYCLESAQLLRDHGSWCEQGAALLRIAKDCGIDASRTFAIGDSYNDEAMIRAAQVGIAPSNADDGILQAADVVVGSNLVTRGRAGSRIHGGALLLSAAPVLGAGLHCPVARRTNPALRSVRRDSIMVWVITCR